MLQQKQKTFFSIILLNKSIYLQFTEGTNHHFYNSLKKPINIFIIHERNQ